MTGKRHPRGATAQFLNPRTELPIVRDGRHEWSAWLRETVARRVAEVDALEIPDAAGVIITPLVQGKSPLRPGSREDRTCDRCRRYVGPGRDYFPLSINPRPALMLVSGLCDVCVRKEGVNP